MRELKLKIAPGEGQYLVRTMRRTNEMKIGDDVFKGEDGESGLLIPEEHARQYQMNLCYVEAVGPGRMLPSGERAPMLYKGGDVVIIRAEPHHIPNEVDQELLALADAPSISGSITEGLDLNNYEIGITLFEEYQNALAAKAEEAADKAEAQAGPRIFQ
jgi:co-chaperonin GroES (HSP10)